MDKNQIKQLSVIFASFPAVKLAYLFGSKATGKDGPLSDYDFAVYLEEKNFRKMSDIKLSLMDKISQTLKTDRLDIVILNTAESPELKYNIIRDGILIYEVEPYKILAEPKILNSYFDFHESLLRHNLTQS
jgi:uncharacterized protein